MHITNREGTRNSALAGDVNLSMAGFGGVFEGKIDDGKGSWVLSARKSYINLISGAVGLTAIPYYYDGQFKVVYDLSQNHKLSWSGIYGNDKIYIDGESDDADYSKRNTTDYIGIQRVDVKQFQYATGMTLKSIWNKNAYSLLTAYYNVYNDDLFVDENVTKKQYDNQGVVFNREVIHNRRLASDQHENKTLALKGELFLKVNGIHEFDFGGSVATGDFIQTLYLAGDSSRYFINGKWYQVQISNTISICSIIINTICSLMIRLNC